METKRHTNYTDETRAEACKKINTLIDHGLSDPEIECITGVPRGTITCWRMRGMVKKCNRKRSLDAYRNVETDTQTTLIGDDPQDDTTEIPDAVETAPYTCLKLARTIVIEGDFIRYEECGDKSAFYVRNCDVYGAKELIKDRAEKLIEELQDFIYSLEEE